MCVGNRRQRYELQISPSGAMSHCKLLNRTPDGRCREPSLKTSTPSGFSVIDAANPVNTYRVHRKKLRTKVRLLHNSAHPSFLLSVTLQYSYQKTLERQHINGNQATETANTVSRLQSRNMNRISFEEPSKVYSDSFQLLQIISRTCVKIGYILYSDSTQYNRHSQIVASESHAAILNSDCS
jgi:hypothetical protein